VVVTLRSDHPLRTIQHFKSLEIPSRSARASVSVIQGNEAITLICDRSDLHWIRESFGKAVFRVRENAARVALIFPPEIEFVPGVVAAVYQAMYVAGLNILEEMSCWTELMMIVDSADTAAVLNELQSLCEQ
jgi:hypothetical protein